MIRNKFLFGWTLLMALGLFLATANAQTPSKPQATKKKAVPAKQPVAAEPEPDLEPKAVEILKAAGSRLATARTMSFTAVESYENPSRQGHPLVYANKYQVTLQRPDKLRVDLSGDGPASEFYYDGKRMMAFAPAENLVAIAEAAPPTIDKALESAYHSAAIYFPFTDLIVTDPYQDLAPGLKLAYYVGQSHIVGGTTTDIVAYAGDGVFAQVWIGSDSKLPLLVHALYLDDPDGLRHTLQLSNWQLDQSVSSDVFGSSTASNAKRIPFAHPHPEPAPGAQPPAKATPAAKPKPANPQ
jgi:hypothetical protein